MLVAYLNSSLVRFLLFLSASSWAVERETVMMEEVLNVPSPFDRGTDELRREILLTFDQIVEKNNAIFINDVAELKLRLDQLVYQLFDINKTEQIANKIQICLTVSFDLSSSFSSFSSVFGVFQTETM